MAFVSKNAALTSQAVEDFHKFRASPGDPWAPKSLKKTMSKVHASHVPIGVLTLEDVIEELITEEIYDETDQESRPDTSSSNGAGATESGLKRQSSLKIHRHSSRVGFHERAQRMQSAGALGRCTSLWVCVYVV